MGRHSLDPAPPAPAAPFGSGTPASARPVAPITDPVLLDAVQRDLRRLRPAAPAAEPAAAAPSPTRRVETPFSGPVDVPMENVIGPHRLEPTAPPRSVEAQQPDRTAPRRLDQVEAVPAAGTPAAVLPVPAPRPMPARSAVPYVPGTTGPVVVPTHRSAPVPVEAPRELDEHADGHEGPVGLSIRTLLLSTGIGLLAATALSLLTLIPR